MAILEGNEVVSSIAYNIKSFIDAGIISNTDEIARLYKDTPIQGMVTPCAFIHSVSTEHTLEMRNYALWHYIIDVRCHPKPAQTNVQTWARHLAVKLLECIDRIQVDGQQVRAKDVTWNVEDNVLHMLCNYTFRVLRQIDPGNPMETLDYSGHAKRR